MTSLQHEEIRRAFTRLEGTWHGQGQGKFPTIDPFFYREEMRFQKRDESLTLHYEQRAWLLGHEKETPSHWETGFLYLKDDESFALVNSQASGRLESMVGELYRPNPKQDQWRLRLESVLYAQDERMKSSSREIVFDGSDLRYDMVMETTAVESATQHLSAHLRKV